MCVCVCVCIKNNNIKELKKETEGGHACVFHSLAYIPLYPSLHLVSNYFSVVTSTVNSKRYCSDLVNFTPLPLSYAMKVHTLIVTPTQLNTS